MHVQQQGQKTVQHTTLGLKMVAAPPLRTGPLFQRPLPKREGEGLAAWVHMKPSWPQTLL